jgi:hypothetical protein
LPGWILQLLGWAFAILFFAGLTGAVREASSKSITYGAFEVVWRAWTDWRMVPGYKSLETTVPDPDESHRFTIGNLKVFGIARLG